MKDPDSFDKSSFEESNEEEVKKGFKETVDEVAKYFGWSNDENNHNEKDKENHIEYSKTENNKKLTEEELWLQKHKGLKEWINSVCEELKENED
jgi:hypothetical protein